MPPYPPAQIRTPTQKHTTTGADISSPSEPVTAQPPPLKYHRCFTRAQLPGRHGKEKMRPAAAAVWHPDAQNDIIISHRVNYPGET